MRGLEGFTPLHAAASNGRAAATALLLARGADPHAVSKEGNTPLHVAAYRAAALAAEEEERREEEEGAPRPRRRESSDDVAELLLAAGASPDAASRFGETPLHKVWRAEGGAVDLKSHS